MKNILMQQYIRAKLNKLGFTPQSDINFVYFWKPKPKEKGVVDESCCCQWWRSKFTYSNRVFLTAEHAMMFKKAEMFEDVDAMLAIMEEKDPWTVKSIGRQVRNFNAVKWDDASYEIVRDINLAKFKQDKRLLAWLKSLPRNTLFVEASPLDRIWGIGLGNDGDVDLTNFSNWQGQNKLGFAVTEVFQELIGIKHG